MWSVALVGLLLPGYLAPRSRAGLPVAPARAHLTRSPTYTSATTWLPELQLPTHHVNSNDLAGREAATLDYTDSDTGIDTTFMPTDSDLFSTPPPMSAEVFRIKLLYGGNCYSENVCSPDEGVDDTSYDATQFDHGPADGVRSIFAVERASEARYDKIVAALLDAGCAIDTQDHRGLTALMLAAKGGLLEVVSRLMDADTGS